MREEFVPKRFSGKSLNTIADANAIIDEYVAKGFRLTLRQLYYQFVARDLIPNTMQSYKALGSTINDGRLAGLIDWDAIEDRTRNLRALSSWGTPAEIIGSAANSYREDLWRTQKTYVECWIEKDALVGVIEGVCNEYRVPYYACRGYSSQSEQYAAGKRFEYELQQGRDVVVLHLGDHDPSGIDMTRDNEDRLRMFAGGPVDVRRLALNMPQVRRYRPPPNPAKQTDSRFAGYVSEFGKSCWELDALNPEVISNLIGDELRSIIDLKAWRAAQAAEDKSRDLLQKCETYWPGVSDYLDNL